jgi:hypothetical protein
MDIVLTSGKYSINPRRITYIEYFKRPILGKVYPNLSSSIREDYQVNPDDNSKETEGFEHCLIIHLTDAQELFFNVKDSIEYERIKSELYDVVGG